MNYRLLDPRSSFESPFTGRKLISIVCPKYILFISEFVAQSWLDFKLIVFIIERPVLKITFVIAENRFYTRFDVEFFDRVRVVWIVFTEYPSNSKVK